MDVLSEVLKVIKLDGALFFNAELSAPWCVREPRSDEFAPFLSQGRDSHVVLYHYVVDGRLSAWVTGEDRIELKSGDVVVFPHGDDHFLSYGEPEKPVDALKTFGGNLSDGLKLTRFGGGGEITRLACGYLVCEPGLGNVVLSGLPKMVKVSLSDQTSGRWLSDSIGYLVGYGDGSDPGSAVVMTKLSEVLFVETLRRYIGELPMEQTGWLAGVRDPFVGKALALIHGKPRAAWTISDIAREVGLSRTRFAERFRHFLGDSPMAYLTRWRLKLGAEALVSSEDSVAEIGVAVGYGSEASFSRAFSREFGSPPSKFRRSHRGAVD